MTFHYLYFIITIIIFSIIFRLSSSPGQTASYVDCLFMATFALTETGLNTVTLSQINTVQQVLLFLLMLGGSPTFVSYFVVLVRKRAFESRFSDLVDVYKAKKKDNSQNIGNGHHGLSNSSHHSQEQCRTILVSPENETSG
jgi:hypothetical protein